MTEPDDAVANNRAADPPTPRPVANATETAQPWWDRPHSLRYRLTDWMAARLPLWIDPPWFVADRKYIEAEGVDFAAQGLAGADIELSTDGIWAVDFYTPATIEALIDCVARHGWDEPGNELRDVLTWLSRAREGSSGTKRIRLKRPGAPGSGFAYFELPLPAFAEQVTGEFATVSHSVLRLTLFFELRAVEQLRISTALHEVLKSEIKRTKRGTSILTPELVREQSIASIRADWRAQIIDWWAINLPGLLSTGDDPSALPTCELAVCDGFDPYPPRGPNGPPHNPMLRALEMNYSGWLFEEAERRDQGYSSALFAANSCRAPGLRHHSILAIPRARYEGTEASLHTAGGPGRFALDVDNRFRRTIGLWAQVTILRYYSELLASAQDKMHSMFGRSASQSVLRRVGAITARCADARTVARESLEFADSWELSYFEGYDFVRERARAREEATSVLLVIKRRIDQEGRHLGVAVSELNEFLHQQANLLTAVANLKLQWWFGLLALCSLAATILGIEPIKHWLGWDRAVATSSSSSSARSNR